ncbi:MAG TPA: DUF6351 family protein [Solirubrobacterales bacterium]|nr:DUF6351 family protein [Solirubrobacterales bacterium]
MKLRNIFLLVATLAGLGFTAGGASAASISIETLSSQSNRVTGGDALMAVTAPSGTNPSKVVIRRNGSVVTSSFKPDPNDPRKLVGLVSGLRSGGNVISAWASGLPNATRHDLFNSPNAGPLFSGPHQSPYICTTEALGAGPPTDENCSAPTTVSYSYRSTDGGFKPLADPASRPADLAQTTTRTGETVDYVVRVEQGTVNRAVYRWAVLASGGVTGNGWNQRFFYNYGGGCSTGHQQGQSVPNPLNNAELSRGYAVLSSSLNVFNTSCNDVLSAETTSMVKEKAIETLGRKPVWTAGQGGSGGSVQIQMIAQNYPGLLDGINPAASFPDNSSPDYPDCRLIDRYYGTAEGAALSNAQREAISGLSNPNGCAALANGADVVNASEGCIEAVVPTSIIFNAVTNPGGVRCTLWDNMVNVYGQDPNTGKARRTLDNVGVQYGLKGLQAGTLTLNEFLDLNQNIGGYDDNGDFSPQRSVADGEALKIAYRTGRFQQGAGGITSIPIVDERTYVDDEANVHQYFNTYRMRARLDRFNGGHANQIMFRAKGGSSTSAMSDTAIDTLGTWMDAIAADDSGAPKPEKVVNNKPANAVDACWITGQRIDAVAQIGANNQCENQYPPHSLPVNQAGAPLDSVIGKCQTKPVDPADYGNPNPSQIGRLNAIFPSGVCDYSKPGVEEQAVSGTDVSFGPQQTITTAKRKLYIKLSPQKVKKTKKGKPVKVTATLHPCPEVTWQRVVFERKVKKGKKTIWQKSGSKIVTGSKCQASIRIKKIKRNTRLRARAEAITGFHKTQAPAKTAKVRR